MISSQKQPMVSQIRGVIDNRLTSPNEGKGLFLLNLSENQSANDLL